MVSGARKRTTFAVKPATENDQAQAARRLNHRLRQIRIGQLGAAILHELDRHHRAETAHFANAWEAHLQPLAAATP